MKQNLIKVVCAILENNDTFLSAQRNLNQANAGLWEFPGGKVNESETDEEAIKRELLEELNIEIAIIDMLNPHVHKYETCTIKLIPFVCKILHGSPSPTEHVQIKWISGTDAYDLVWSPADIPVLEEYLDILNQDKQ